MAYARHGATRCGGRLLAVAVALAVVAGLLAGLARASVLSTEEPYFPQGLAYDAGTNTLYSGDSGGVLCRVVAVKGSRIRHVAGAGTCGYSGDGRDAKAALIEPPNQLAVDASHNVYIAAQYTVRRVSHASNVITDYVGNPEYRCLIESLHNAAVGLLASQVGVYAEGMAVDPISGHLFVENFCEHAILEIDETGLIVGRYGGLLPNEALGVLTFDRAGNLYFVSGALDNQVRKMDREHNFSLVAGSGAPGIEGNGGPATSASLDHVVGLAVDSRGVIFLSTSGSETREYIRQVSPEGTIEAVAGTPWPPERNNPSPPYPGMQAREGVFWSVGQLAVDGADDLYISDFNNKTLLVIEGDAEPNRPVYWVLHEYVPILGGERLGGGNPSENTCDQGCVGDPVNTATGEYSETTQDLAIAGRGLPLDLTRTYGSLSAGVNGPLGFGWTSSYLMSASAEEAGVVTIRQENGSELQFEPNGRGGYLGSSAQLATLAANEGGGWTLTRRGHDRFVFNAEGKLVRELDPNELATALSYESGRLKRVTDSAGRTLALEYDGEGHLVEVRDSAGRTVRYGYTSGDLTSVVDARGKTWRYDYDEEHHLTRKTDPNGHVRVTNRYDGEGLVVRQTDAREGVTEFSYRPGLTQITSPGRRVRQDYYAGGELVQRIDGVGTGEAAAWRYEYDPATHGTTKVTDPLGHVWRAAYNAAGLRTSTTDPLEHTTRSTYDALGDRLTLQDANGVTTTWAYDEHGNLQSASTPLGAQTQVTTFTHGDRAHPADVTAIEDPRRKTTQLGYDANGNLTSVTDPLGDRTTMTYDEAGRLATVVSPRGHEAGARGGAFTTSFQRDAAGAITQLTDGEFHVTRYAYDPAGNLESLTDAKRRVTTYGYDEGDLLTAIHRPDETTLRRGYDAEGALTSTTDGAGHATRYAYDALGRLSGVTDPLEHTRTYAFDAAGNLRSMIDPRRRTTTYGYDAANRLRSITYSDRTTPNVTFEYDADGQRTSMRDGTGTSTYNWDALHRLVEHTDGHGNVIRYGYDLANELTSLTYANGRTVLRTYDNAGRLESVTDWLSATTRFGYDLDSNLARVTFPAASGDVDNYTYDNIGGMRVAQFTKGVTVLASITYAHDAEGLPISIGQAGLPGGESRPTYTALDQVASAEGRAYEYDAADNVTRLAGAGPLTYDNANELRAGPVGPGGTGRATTFTFEEDGNRLGAIVEGGASVRFSYDQADRMATATSGGGATYAYDGDGLRSSKTVARVTTQLTWDHSGGLPLDLSDGTNNYLYGPGGLPIEHIDGSGVPTYYHHDEIGSTRLLTEARGAASATFSYAPYGALTGRTGTQTTPLGFAGEYTDAETGFQYLRARVYDPASGQFLQRDPLTPLTGEPYVYAGGNPLAATDPSGLFLDGALDIAGDIGMGISEAAAGALNELTFGLSNRIAGVDGSCTGFGYRFGGLLGLAGGLFDGEGEAQLFSKGVRVVEEDLPGPGIEHGFDVLGLDPKGRNYMSRVDPDTSYHVDLHPTRHGGPHIDIHRRRPKTKIRLPLNEPWQVPG